MKSYVQAGGYHLMAMVGLGHVAFIVFQILTNMWLSKWSEDDNADVDYQLGVYGALGAGQCKYEVHTALFRSMNWSILFCGCHIYTLWKR